MIDQPEKFFALEPVLKNMAAFAYQDKNPPPSGQLRQLVVKGMPVTPDHYKVFGAGTDPKEDPKPSGDQIVVVTVRDPKGLKQYTYKNGVRVDDNDSGSGSAQPKPGPSEGPTEPK
jgi:hypothetical protein